MLYNLKPIYKNFNLCLKNKKFNKKMGCINNIRIGDKKNIIKSKQIVNNEKSKKLSHAISEKIYTKKLYEDNPLTNISQNIEDMIENNPLPFVKIKLKNNHL